MNKIAIILIRLLIIVVHYVYTHEEEYELFLGKKFIFYIHLL